jgi:tRNA G10  N-methylase Trm11
VGASPPPFNNLKNMDNINDYIEALKQTCKEKKDDFFDTIEFEDKIIRVHCIGDDLYAEILYKISVAGYPMTHDQLKHILETEKKRIKRKSTDTDEDFKNKKITISRDRKIGEIIGEE